MIQEGQSVSLKVYHTSGRPPPKYIGRQIGMAFSVVCSERVGGGMKMTKLHSMNFSKNYLSIIKYPVPSDLREEVSLGPQGKEMSVIMAGEHGVSEGRHGRRGRSCCSSGMCSQGAECGLDTALCFTPARLHLPAAQTVPQADQVFKHTFKPHHQVNTGPRTLLEIMLYLPKYRWETWAFR